MKLTDPIAKHAAYVFNHILSHPYPCESDAHTTIPRLHHGIAHACRVAAYIPLFLKLFQRKTPKIGLGKLHPDELKCLQIAALFHDSARKNDGEDLWDRDSADLCFDYLTNTLRIESSIATPFAHAIANKDYQVGETYYKRIKTENNTIDWQQLTKYQKPKSLYAILLHDADCLDIIRARPIFDSRYLHFYQHLTKPLTTNSFNIMEQLICSARSLIASCGESRLTTEYDLATTYPIREQYSRSDCYEQIQKKMSAIAFFNEILSDTSHLAIDSATYHANANHPDFSVQPAFRSAKLVFRSIATPTAIFTKKDETHAEREIRKLSRRPKIATRSGKLGKHGNPGRSTSLAAPGASVYSMAGYGIMIHPGNKNHIRAAHHRDINSGR